MSPSTNTAFSDELWFYYGNPFSVKLGEEFKNYEEVIQYQEGLTSTFEYKRDNATLLLKKIFDDEEATPKDYLRWGAADSTLGGNDAINCYYQFNRDDDIVHLMGRTDRWAIEGNVNRNDLEHKGVGRVYHDLYNRHQQILWMQFGTPLFTGVAEFYANTFDADMVSLQNSGGNATIFSKIGKLLGTIGTVAFAFPILAIKWIAAIPSEISHFFKNVFSNKENTTKYYDFSACMPLYYRMANGMALHLAINLGLYDGGYEQNNDRMHIGHLPKIFPEGKLDVFRIISRKSEKLNPDGEKLDVDSMWKTAKEGVSNFLGKLSDAALGMYSFIGFRIEKSTDSSESFSNSTGQSQISSLLNSKISEVKDSLFTIQNGKVAGGGGIGEALIDSAVDLAVSGVRGVTDTIGVNSITSIMMGDGYIDIPEIWKESSFTKSYSFDIALRSPYGDPLSIYQSIYFPLTLLLTGALPRAVGANAYTQPFLVRAFCKGMFSIPMGIIDSMTVKRGSAEHGWSYQNLPTAVDVSFTIKDLSPVMFMALPAGGDSLASLLQIFGENNSFQEYMSTLSGFGLKERLTKFKQIIRRIKYHKALLIDDVLNPNRWALGMGINNIIAQSIAELVPISKLSNN